MTLIAMTLFLVPLIGLCVYILIWGIFDIFIKKKTEAVNEAELLKSK